ncbi:uncharacterized protein LOC111712801 [Eurytemora carolleeae]|uniref:uncharacterized protein LOC111712801 n=1 Tax=Eurytemora carolleeae TaxID=1294199 RepID=UPI000C78D718|nr:uncharacterized protein LOC111712801 [Eurytemora carolleeae]|eukprot:XP_023343297.1 uncharacterized protein LOC111712801 [Eurytemora affinis]
MATVETKIHFLLLQWGFIIASTVNLLVSECGGPINCLLYPFLCGTLPVGCLLLVLERFEEHSTDAVPQLENLNDLIESKSSSSSSSSSSEDDENDENNTKTIKKVLFTVPDPKQKSPKKSLPKPKIQKRNARLTSDQMNLSPAFRKLFKEPQNSPAKTKKKDHTRLDIRSLAFFSKKITDLDRTQKAVNTN